MSRPRVTPKQREELEAVFWFTDGLKKPTHLFADLERTEPTVRSLIRRGLINWRPSVRGSGFGKKFRAVTMTNLGRQAIGAN